MSDTPIKINIGVEDLTEQIEALNSQLNQLRTTMQGFGQQQYSLGQGISNVFNQTGTSATSAADSIKTFFASLGGNRPGGTALGGILNYGLESGIAQDILSFPMRYLQSTVSTNRQTALNVSGGLAGQMWATGTNNTNVSGGPGRTGPNIFRALGYFSGSNQGLPTGTPDEIIQMLNIARQAGGMVDLSNLAQNGPSNMASWANQRGAGFMRSVYQAQQMYPGTPLPALAGSIGGFVANTGAQQQSAYLTGGAFSMVKSGGRQKTLAEWAESVLRWLENERPGQKRGQPFDYGELISQQFPGSNIDAWLAMNGVPPDMREMWWTYALGKAKKHGTTAAGVLVDFETDRPAGSTAGQRLRTTGTLTGTAFGLAEAMSGQYFQREQANRGFARGLQNPLINIIQSSFASGPLSVIAKMPDVMEEFLMTLMERLGPLGAAVSGTLGWGALAGGSGAATGLADMTAATSLDELFENILGPAGTLFGGLSLPAGMTGNLGTSIWDMISKELIALGALGGDVGYSDLGDVGDVGWGAMGGTTPASLHPDMNRKVGRMMRANPRLRINSGRRDEALQRQLKGKGHSRVSGTSSAHTRGLAADLGPSSEYGWITANAKRFGLKSGAGVGEPWHVGIGDTGEEVATTLGGLGNLFNILLGTGGTEDGGLGAVGSALPGLLNMMFGGFSQGAGGTPAAPVQVDPDFEKKFTDAMKWQTGGKFGFETALSKTVWGSVQSIADAIAAVRGAAAVASAATDVVSTAADAVASAKTLAAAVQAIGQDPTGLSAGAMVAKIANYAGFKGSTLQKTIAISRGESGWDPGQVNMEGRDNSYGLMQINMIGGLGPDRRATYGLASNDDLYDPNINMRVAWGISSQGTNFEPWTVYTRGTYQQYMDDAAAAMVEAGISNVGDVEAHTSPTPTSTGRNGGMVFNNTFQISGGGNSGNGGIDVRRTVALIADQLEAEMKKRLARFN